MKKFQVATLAFAVAIGSAIPNLAQAGPCFVHTVTQQTWCRVDLGGAHVAYFVRDYNGWSWYER